MYNIKEYSKKKAKELGVVIKPSNKKKKKLDVFKDDKLICSIGALGYGDYPTFISTKGLDYALEKRRLYKARHKNDSGIAGFYANKILW